jgi:hypothetical protein
VVFVVAIGANTIVSRFADRDAARRR